MFKSSIESPSYQLDYDSCLDVWNSHKVNDPPQKKYMIIFSTFKRNQDDSFQITWKYKRSLEKLKEQS